MSQFAMPVSLYMTTPVVSVKAAAGLDEVQDALVAHHVSALAVTDDGGRLLGVVSRTDLLHVGRRQAGMRRGSPLLTLPRRPVSEVMEPSVISVDPEDSVAAAAGAMVRHHVHRVFAVKNDSLVGVISTRDVMLAVRDKRIAQPLSERISAPVFTVDFDDPVALAVERLEKAHVSGLVVVEDDWPIGVFGQIEALESKDLPRDTSVEACSSPAMLCLDLGTSLHRAAAQAASMDVRRVIAVSDRRVKGILTGLDFARVASD